MLKATLISSLALAMFATAAPARTMQCDASTVTKMQASAQNMAASSKKDMAMKQMQMAKDDMAMKKHDDCMTHMRKARDLMFK